MAKIKIYNMNGENVGEMDLNPTLFCVDILPALVHEAVVAQLANARIAIAHTKDRSEVRGGGRKPWKQKGTGRARHGSRRSPIWIGGGVTFGPRNSQNFSKKMNKKARRKALAMVLSDKVNNGNIIIVDQLNIEDGKTKNLESVLRLLPVDKKKTLIIVDPKKTDVSKAAKNITSVETLPNNCLNVVDLLRFEFLLLTKESVDQLTDIYTR